MFPKFRRLNRVPDELPTEEESLCIVAVKSLADSETISEALKGKQKRFDRHVLEQVQMDCSDVKTGVYQNISFDRLLSIRVLDKNMPCKINFDIFEGNE